MSSESDIMKKIEKMVPKSLPIIDIGAYNGNVAFELMKMMRTKPEDTYLIEACPDNAEVLRKNCLSRGYPCNVYNLMIAGTIGSRVLHVVNHKKSDGTSQANSMYKEFVDSKEWAKKSKAIEVTAITLDSFYRAIGKNHIGLLKINCEGGEFDIFDDGLEFLDKTEFIYIQIHGKSKLFNSPEFKEKKKRIFKLLDEDFIRIIGKPLEDLLKSEKHEGYLWRHK